VFLRVCSRREGTGLCQDWGQAAGLSWASHTLVWRSTDGAIVVPLSSSDTTSQEGPRSTQPVLKPRSPSQPCPLPPGTGQGLGVRMVEVEDARPPLGLGSAPTPLLPISAHQILLTSFIKIKNPPS
jgi:hypothetical protein